jgi:DnaJ-class molecular chaperone
MYGEIDVTKCDECSAAVQICERCDGAGRKRWSGECSYCRGTGQICMANANHRW